MQSTTPHPHATFTLHSSYHLSTPFDFGRKLPSTTPPRPLPRIQLQLNFQRYHHLLRRCRSLWRHHWCWCPCHTPLLTTPTGCRPSLSLDLLRFRLTTFISSGSRPLAAFSVTFPFFLPICCLWCCCCNAGGWCLWSYSSSGGGFNFQRKWCVWC